MSTKAKCVLIIDDEEAIREVVRMSLELTRGWEVCGAASGVEGLARATFKAPDCILLDVMMPGLDGPSTLERLKVDSRTASIPVIFLTAKIQAAERQGFRELGVSAVLTKPFDPMLLASQVERSLGWL